MKKVTHLVRWLLPFTASFIRNQIVCHEGYVPSIVYLQKKEGLFLKELTSRFEAFYPFRSGLSRFFYERFRLLGPAEKRKIKEFLKKQAPDILHVHYGVDCLIYADIIRELNLPTCVSFYGYDCSSFPSRFYGYGKTLLRQKVFSNPAIRVIFAMTEDMEKDLIRLGCPREKIIVHYYGTETKPFFQERSFLEKEVINILIISSLEERKGHAFLIEAFKQLCHTTEKKMHLHIVGDGVLRQTIEKQVEKTGLANITLHGRVAYHSQAHMDFLAMADIFVHPSVTPADGCKEGIPGALIEAMASGLPSVSTYHAGIPYIIDNERTGMLVKEYDTHALKNVLERLVRDAVLRKSIALAGQAYALHHLDLLEKEKELEQIYDALLEGRLEQGLQRDLNTTN